MVKTLFVFGDPGLIFTETLSPIGDAIEGI